MTTSLEHPTKKALRGRPPLSPRGRTVACAIAAVAALLLVAGLAAAVGGRGPFASEDAIDNAADRLPSGWAGLEPLLPLAPGLREMSDLKRSAAGGASRVLAARGGSAGALRVSALPPVGAFVAAPGFAPATTPSVRVPPAGLVGPVGGARRLLRRTPSLGDLATIIDRELGGLPGGAVDGVAQIPPIDPLPNGVPRVVIPPVGPIPEVVIPPVGVPLPGAPVPGSGEPVPGVPLPGPGPVDPLPGGGAGPGAGPVNPLPGGATAPGSGAVSLLSGGVAPARRLRPVPPLNLTVADLRADPRFDVLLVSRGRRVLERYTFSDRNISGLSAQINLGSRLLAAEALGDARPLAHVAAAPLARAGAPTKAPVAGPLRGVAKAALRAGPGVGGDRGTGGGASGARGGSGPPASGRAVGSPRRGGRPGGRKARAGATGGQTNGSSPRRARRNSRSLGPARRRSRPNRGAHGGASSPRGRGRPRGSGRSSPGHGHSKPKKHRRSSRGSHGGRGGSDDDDDDDDD